MVCSPDSASLRVSAPPRLCVKTSGEAKSGLIEAWGRGFDKIKAGCKEYGGDLPDYEISDSGVMVLCKACPAYLSLLKNAVKTASGGEGKSEGKSEGKGEGKSEAESNREAKSCEKVLAMLSAEPTLTREVIAGKIGLSLSRVEKVIRQLRNEGKLVREGSSRNGRWKVIRKE